ncbi:MAG: PAS domain S-box protein [Phycisphaerales bacterium]|nr:PAS domain S-box protein [Phycisphaerales bacterium]MCI0675838.1 PAS domain S-box protein [Phycisphaerales bacterium]
MPTRTQQRSSSNETLEQAIAQYRAVLAAALDPIVTIDANGIIQSASDSIERVFGWKPEEVVGQNVRVLMPEPHHSAHDGYLASYRKTHQTNILGRTREFFAVRKDGTRFPMELSVSRVDVPGAPEPWFMGIIHDITERKRVEDELARHRAHLQDMVNERTAQLQATNEQLRQADRLASIGTLAAGLGHDMNNVLLPIRARLDALDAAELPPKAKEQFLAVRRSIAYLQQLSDGLHLLALDPDDAEASMGVTNLMEWWKQVGPLLAKAAPKRVTVEIEFASELPELAVAPHRLTQAMLNLVVNAGEAIRGDGQIRIWARATKRRGIVQVGVSDTGEGMAPEVKKHALDPFFTTKKRGLGTGLGLSLVQGVAQSAGGSVEIESELGKGTTVIMNVPIATRRADAIAQATPDRTAVVSLGDRRSASFVAAIITAGQFTARIADGQDPGSSRLWVIDPDVVTIAAAKRYLRADHKRRIVVFGPAADDWLALGALVIDDPTNFDMIRTTLGEALAKVVSASQ